MNTFETNYPEFLREVTKSPDTYDKVCMVNNFFNQLLYVSDYQQYMIEEYWATPKTFLSRGAGDCEDFAISKYFTLLECGVPRDELRLGFVELRSFQGVESHMVLLWYPPTIPRTDPLVLDNAYAEVCPLSQRKDINYVYSFNHDGVWTSNPDHKVRDNNLSQWKGLLSRMEQENTTQSL